MPTVTEVDVEDIRFPTSRQLDGSDAMNLDPDYSAAYVVVRTDAGEALSGHALVFTIGRGTEVQAAAIRAYAERLVGRDAEKLVSDMGALNRELQADSQLRWLGPEKGVIQMALGAVLNAVWDLRCRMEGRPLWQVLSTMSPEELVDCVDLRYLDGVMDRERALDILRRAEPGRTARTAQLLAEGYPAYTTSAGWLGYPDAKVLRLAREAISDGFTLIKLKVGGNLEDDVRRIAMLRAELGEEVEIAVDANQRWEVDEAIAWTQSLAPYRPYWVEEPTSPDDVLGHAAIRRGISPVRVATGEHVHNRIIFKQLIQAQAVDVIQIDATRVGGINENLAILLMAADAGIPVCPHAGGVGLCELVQHLAMFDFVAVSGALDGRAIEYVDHLHEHFLEPVDVVAGRYRAPMAPGSGAEMLAASRKEFAFPGGPAWLQDSHD